MKDSMLHTGLAPGLLLARPKQLALALSRSKTFRDTAWVTIGNLANRGLALISFMILTRTLGPHDYGILSTAMAVLTMAAEISDLGINASAIRFGAQYAAQKDWDNLATLYSVVLRSRIIISAVVFVVGALASEPLARLLLKDPEFTPYLWLAFGGVFSTLLNSAFVSVLQASQAFGCAAVVSLVSGGANLLGVALLAAVGSLTPWSGLVVFLVSPLVAAVAAYLMIPRRLLRLRLWDADMARKLGDFGKWMALWALAVMLESRVGTFMLASLMDSTEVGYYNAALRIATLAQLISAAYGTVLNPKLSSITERTHLLVEFRRSLAIALTLTMLIGAGSLLAPWVVPLLTGSRYSQSVPLLQILLIGMAFFTLNLPFSSTLYALKRPQVFALSAILGLMLTSGSSLILIPPYGAIGASIAFVLTQAMAVSICAGALAIYCRRG